MDRSWIARLRRSEDLLPAAGLLVATALYALPLLKNISYWGRTDWDQFTFLNAVPYESLLRYGQFPLWNPFSNGGNTILAMPHSAFLSPQFLLVLLHGPVVGVKLQWIAGVFAGMMGMYALARRLALPPVSRCLPPAVFMLSSHYTLHLREGHLEWTAMAIMPWTVLCLLRSRTERSFLAWTALSMALMIYSGGVYVFAATAVFLGLHATGSAWIEKKAAPLTGLAVVFALTFLLASAKLVPMLELLRESPRPTKDEGRLEAVLLPKLLLSRGQNALYENRAELPARLGLQWWDREGWHEFGAYVGAIPLLLSLAGLYAFWERHKPLAWAGAACLWISMGRTAWFVDLWSVLHRLPVYRSLQVPSRFLMCVLFCLALFAGLGLSLLEKGATTKARRWALAALVALVAADLLAVCRPIAAGAFTIPPYVIARAPDFRQGGDPFDSYRRMGSNSAMYPALLANRGTIKSYDIVGVTRGR
ncbi:MAG: hypothetical protein M0D55_01260 [Elusimicrobiota bacterium]|nr:MAG: hypothetical protein M0D55_01260 [Elusimicrobiota bacterium]